MSFVLKMLLSPDNQRPQRTLTDLRTIWAYETAKIKNFIPLKNLILDFIISILNLLFSRF